MPNTPTPARSTSVQFGRSLLPLVRAGIEKTEYRQRRERVLELLQGAAAVVLAGDGGEGRFKPDADFVYLTGITTEAGAAVLFNPGATDPTRRIVLMLKPLTPERDRWDRYRDPISEQMQADTGFDTVMRTDMLPRLLGNAGRVCKRLACLHQFASPSAPVGADLGWYRKVTERAVGIGIEDKTNILPEMRAVKSAAELALMREAARATAAGYARACQVIAPGVGEDKVQRAIESAYLDAGAETTAYDSIVGTGLNATVLHYHDNCRACEAGELVLIDSGASYRGYACDVTRTYPVSGTFTPEQREVYEVVLAAQEAAIEACKPGAFLWEADRAAREVIRKAGYADAYIHSIGHQLGLEVHDATPEGPLREGMVVTIEPGVYLPERGLGVRIEDDVLITKRGREVMTTAIPKTVAEIEAAMAAARR